MNLEEFKTQYRHILRTKLENRLKQSSSQYHIQDLKEQLNKLNCLDNIKFDGMDFWLTSSRPDKLIVSIITNNIKLYRESLQFDTFDQIISDAKMYNYNIFIIEDDKLIDFTRVENPDKVYYTIDGKCIEINEDVIKEKYKNTLPKRTNSYYTTRYTRSGSNMGHWNIGGVNVYD